MKKIILLCCCVLFVQFTSANAENLLKVVALQYKLRTANPAEDLNFDRFVPNSQIQSYNLIVGSNWTTIRPVGIVQNVSNKILTFKTKLEVYNNDSKRYIYRILCPVSSKCLSLDDSHLEDCNGNPNVRARYCNVKNDGSNYNVEYLPFPGNNNLTGIPPGGFAEVEFTQFEFNELFENNIGNFTVSFFIIPIEPDTESDIKEGDYTDDTLKIKLKIRRKYCSELFEPKNGDTVKIDKNCFVGLSSQTYKTSYKLEFSKDKLFDKIEKYFDKLEVYNVPLDYGSHYYWRLNSNSLDSNCTSEIGDFFTEKPTSVDNYLNTNLSLSPNPATDYITIFISEINPTVNRRVDKVNHKIQIFDILGIEVSSAGGSVNEVDGGGSIRIDVSNLPAGVYFIRIGDKVEKFLKM